MKEDKILVAHILEAISKIEKYIAGVDFESFCKNDMMNDAVIKELEIIGEAAGKCNGEFRKKHAKIPWDDVIGMRNRLIHEYFGIDLEVVWTTCKEDLVVLKTALSNQI